MYIRTQRALAVGVSVINSDVNGSLQIMMKVFPNAFKVRYGIEAVLTPIVINAA